MKYLLLIFLLFAAPLLACTYSTASTDTYVEVCVASDACRVLFHADIPRGSQTKNEEFVRAHMQNFLDTRLTLNSFPAADPAKASDPNCENFYWGDIDGLKASPVEATHLIARGCIIEFVEWNGTEYKFQIRRADRCQSVE